MTDEIFKALRARFRANPTLITTGRDLLQGFDESRLVNEVRPYTEVNIEKTTRELGTFATDIDEWDLRFRYHAKDIRTISADVWLAGMRAMFKDAGVGLDSYGFVCVGVNEASLSSPRNTNSAYDAAIRFMMTVEWRQLSPSIRGG